MGSDFNKVLEVLKQDLSNLQGRVDSVGTINDGNRSEFDALCYEMCAVESRIRGLLLEAREIDQIDDVVESNDEVFNILYRMLKKVRGFRIGKVGA